jgi:hypothetical protein
MAAVEDRSPPASLIASACVFEAVEGHDRAKLYVRHVDGHAGQHGRLEGCPALRGLLAANS